MEHSNRTLPSATPVDLPVNVMEYPVNDAGRWMQNRLDGTIHAAFNTDIDGLVYDTDKEKFALLADDAPLNLVTIYKQAEIQKREFIATVNKYNTVAKQSGSMQMDTNADYTWNDVLYAQESFSQERENVTSRGIKGIMYKQLRRFGDNSETFQSWLKLLPTESHYLSVLCGGLTLILGAAQQMSEIREDVRNFIEDLPSRLSKAKEYINIFQDSLQLHQCSADLYVAILSTLDDVVQTYHKHVAHRFGSALLKQKRSGKELQNKIKSVQDCGERLVSQAKICSMQIQKRQFDGGKDLTRLLVTSTRKQDLGFKTVVLQQNDMMEVLQLQEKRIQSQESLLEGQANLLNQLLNTLKATPSQIFEAPPRPTYLECEDSTGGYQTPRGRSPSPGAIRNQERSRQRLKDLLNIFEVDGETDTAAKDASILLHIVGNLSSGSQDRTVALITSPVIQKWLTSTVSLPLIVNGQMFSSEGETRQSPLSYFCTKLVDSILPPSTSSQTSRNRTVFAVRWFCGQHTNCYDYGPGLTDYEAHPPGMLSNMLVQLIVQLLECSFLPQLDHLSLPKNDPQLFELCSLFNLLVGALPRGSILFIVIDGISYYEDEERREECMEVLSTMMELTRGGPGSANGCLIKLLVTSPLRSHHVQHLFEDTDILDLDEYIPPNGGFTALQWNMGVGRVIADA
ncbi:hypothetical protein HO133_004769 [Letharia lupina]|uniref:Uncharacterized protein n=1 Tax=Letharia lupina TaxID=560253 RepID=A0A8H6FKZ0_9LECA|nr:uncharacterized protein HO133_004769 [Letharia lupina]KAF6230427.1 hypothetical protein HO133_004769 [Letharia lupina]